ncbi:hypothetical protein GCM10009000_053500 [Halobacterium noricense]|uniref:Uncharacterized protein n=2 Tax=Haladaptatus pallidirubidus TaxID=1008152 RepID=A0AAV3UMK7_9EURY
MNFDDEPHTVHVLLRRDGETAYRKSLRLKAGRSDDPSGSKFEAYPAESGADVLYAWRDDQSKDQRRKLDFSEYETECIGFQILVGDIDESAPRVSIWQTTNCNAGT